jgi:hypothetical protein
VSEGQPGERGRTDVGRAVASCADAFLSGPAAGPGVSSPLGLWLLLAVTAPLALADDLAELEVALGMPVDDAARAAADLLADPHPAVAAAVAVWSDPARLLPGHAAWTPPPDVERGPLPSQAGLDHWASRHTGGLVRRFPVQVDPATLVVLGSALATRVTWDAPLTAITRGPDRGRLRLEDGDGWQAVVSTEAAGDVAVAAPRTASGLDVLSVVAAPEVPPAAVHRAAHEVLARGRGAALRVAGDGHAWTLDERVELRAAHGSEVETWTTVLSAWSLESDHDLTAAPGVAALFRAVEQRWFPPAARPLVGVARQRAVASLSREGFDAAAVTGMALRAGSAPPSTREVLVREVSLRIDRPHAVVAAVAADAPGPWAGVPVFSAWVVP